MKTEPVYMKFGFEGWEFVSKEKYDKTVSEEDRMKLYDDEYVNEVIEDFKRRAVEVCMKEIRGYRLNYTVDADGDGYPIEDALTPPDCSSITKGIEEVEYLVDSVAGAIELLPLFDCKAVGTSAKLKGEKE